MIFFSFGFLRMGTVGIIAQLFAKSDYREISKKLSLIPLKEITSSRFSNLGPSLKNFRSSCKEEYAPTPPFIR